MQTFDGIGIVVIEGEVHRLIYPLLGCCLLQCHLSLEDAAALIGDDRTACAHVAADVHRHGHDADRLVGSADRDAGHAVFCDGEWRTAFGAKGAVAIAGQCNFLTIHCASQGERACIEAGVCLEEVAIESLEGHVFRVATESQRTEHERFFRAGATLVLLYPHGIDVCHTEDALVGNDDVAALVWIDIVALQNVTQVAVIAFATDVGA